MHRCHRRMRVARSISSRSAGIVESCARLRGCIVALAVAGQRGYVRAAPGRGRCAAPARRRGRRRRPPRRRCAAGVRRLRRRPPAPRGCGRARGAAALGERLGAARRRRRPARRRRPRRLRARRARGRGRRRGGAARAAPSVFGPVATLSMSSSDSSPSVSRTRSGFTSATSMPLIVSPCCTRRDLPPCDLAQERGGLAVDDGRAGQRELAALHAALRPRRRRRRRRRAARRIEQRALDRLALRASGRRRSCIRAAARRDTGCGATTGVGRRRALASARPQSVSQPISSGERDEGQRATRAQARTRGSSVFIASAIASLRRRRLRLGGLGIRPAPTSSCTLTSGSCPARGLEAAERVQRPHRQVLDDEVRLLRLERVQDLLQRGRRREELHVDADLPEAPVVARRRGSGWS